MTEAISSGSPPEQQPTSDTSEQLSAFDDPCAAYKTLTRKKAELVSGQAVAEYEYVGNGTTRRLKYSMANISALDTLIRQAQAECAKSIGAPNPGRRFALTAGNRDQRIPAMRWSARLGYY